eukprot:TRINITY_DN5447_c0_g1_i1.p1 TRINITY_DN5447_c0_g1~~TRINITY_DN5447_c0_g1_i1.p1  ORF type:complete len:719 (+),score=131.05 TRINITY_DN5447_c0_g1_i1:68-2158(+)
MKQPSEEDVARSVEARKAGNKALVAGRSEEAIEKYTEGLEAVPNDYLLLGNRSEAKLVMKDAKGALDDAVGCMEHSENKWPKAFIRKANAEVALGLTRDAIRTLREGLRQLTPQDDRQPWLDKIASIKEVHFNVSTTHTTGMGRTLTALKPFPMGSIVMTEHPVVYWVRKNEPTVEGDKPLTEPTPKPPVPPKEALRDAGFDETQTLSPTATDDIVEKSKQSVDPNRIVKKRFPDEDRVAAICEDNGVADAFSGILFGFLQLSKEEQDIVMACCCPTIPLSPIAVVLVNIAYRLSLMEVFKQLGQQTILKLIMINKVNAHGMKRPASTHAEAGIFDVASKMAHSCTPNVLYDGGECKWIAVKNIPKDGLVTFSYNSTSFLVHSAEVRQTVLRQTHLFVCKCERCIGTDHTRGIRCPCGKGSVSGDSDDATRYRKGTKLLDAERGLYNEKAWFCAACKGTWTDTDMEKELQRENSIEREVHDMHGKKDLAEKGQYEKLKDLTERALQYLSRDHWCYLRLCYLLSLYHYQLARRSRASAGELLNLCVMWGKKYSQGLTRTKVTEAAPMIFVEWDYWMSMVCGDWPHLMQEKVSLLEAAYPTYSTMYPEELTTVSIKDALAKSKRNITTFRNKVFLGKAYKNLRYDYDESELFEKWEDHLADRYITEVKKRDGGAEALDALLRDGHADPVVQSVLSSGK